MTQFTVLSVTSSSVVGETKEGVHKIFTLEAYPNLKVAKKGDVIEDTGEVVALESKPPKNAKTASSGRGSTKSTANQVLM